MTPILMTEEYWRNSQLSVARFYGRCRFNGHEYWIVNKDGLNLFALSAIAEREGRDKAIEPGEPADLIRRDFITYYRKLGRDKFIETLQLHQHAYDNELKAIFIAMTEKKKEKEKEPLTINFNKKYPKTK